MLWFGLVHPRHWGWGCDDLLGIYGGEAIYGTFDREGPIVDKLRSIGQPAVVHFRLDVSAFKGWNENPAGQTAIWAWHKRIRSVGEDYWCGGYTQASIPASAIMKVERWSRK